MCVLEYRRRGWVDMPEMIRDPQATISVQLPVRSMLLMEHRVNHTLEQIPVWSQE